MNTIKTQIIIYVDGVCMGTFNGWANANTYARRQEALGRDASFGFAR